MKKNKFRVIINGNWKGYAVGIYGDIVSMYKISIDEYYKSLLAGKDTSIPDVKSWKLIKDRNSSRLDNVALSEDEHKMSYGEMFEAWDDTARAFSALGISRNNNSRALVLMPNVAETAIIDYALDMTGAVCDFIDPTTGSEKIERYINDEKITDIISLDLLYAQSLKKVSSRLKDEFKVRNIVLYHSPFMNSQMPKKIQKIGKIVYHFNRFDGNVVRIGDALRNSKYQQIDYDTMTPSDLSLITHTSGTTTGMGKPIPITDFNRNALIKQHDLADIVFEPGQKILHFIPYFAAYGSVNTVHLGFSQGMELVQLPLFQPESFGKYLLAYKPAIVMANHPAWVSMLKDPTLEGADLSFLKQAVSGGTPTVTGDEELINDFFKKHGADIVLKKGHGLSQLCGCGTFTLDGYNHVGGMGVPLPLTTYLIRDPKSKQIIVEDGNSIEGEAMVSSPNLTSGILDGNIVVPTEIIDGVRYLPTKDVVRKLPDGSLEFVERMDRMFNRKDAYNIYPANIESLISSFTEVDDCIIVPSYDEKQGGNVPRAYVKLGEKFRNIDLEDFITRHVKDYFIDGKANDFYQANFRDIPEIWTFVDDIPKNTMGKHDFHKIMENGIPGVSINLQIESDNMGVKNFEIVYPESSGKKLIK